MKRILIIAIAILGISFAQAQDTTKVTYVINKVVPDTIGTADLTFTKLVKQIGERAETQITNYKFRLETQGDTTYNEQVFDAYIAACNNLYNQVVNQYLVNDTLVVYVIDGFHYFENELMSIEYSRLEVKDRFDTLAKRWGEDRVRDDRRGKALITQWQLLTNFLNQLKDN
jgi:hypothetical protein